MVQEGIPGQRQQESPFEEVLEQVEGYSDTDAPRSQSGKNRSLEGFKEEFQGKKASFSEWMLDRLKEAFEKGCIRKMSAA